MKRLLVVAALVVAAPFAANAQGERMSDSRFLRASQCVAYADLEQLQGDGFNAGALRAEVEAQKRQHTLVIRDQARNEARDIRISGQRSADNELALERLRGARAELCNSFVATGLVQIETATPPS